MRNRIFEDRRDAGRALVPALQRCALTNPIIMNIGNPEVPPGNPTEVPPQEIPPDIPPDNPTEVPPPTAPPDIPPEQPVEVPEAPPETS